MRFDVLTIFPEMFRPVLGAGVVGRAIERGDLELHTHDLRAFSHDRHRTVDDVPFGGGAGMVMRPAPIYEAVDEIRRHNPGPVLITEPWGEPFDQRVARELAAADGLVVICGRYEGVDDRVRSGLRAREVSIGPYVLSGGELAAMVIIDAVARLRPGVVGDSRSLEQDAFAAADGGGFPQFTRPAEYRGMRVPDVLLSGDHSKIREWRRANARPTIRSAK